MRHRLLHHRTEICLCDGRASPLGELIVCSIILAISIAMVGIRWKNYLAMLYMLGVTALTFLVSGILSIFMPVNFAAITLGLVIASSLFLVIVSIRELTLNYIWIALFSLVSLGYLFFCELRIQRYPRTASSGAYQRGDRLGG